VSEAPDRQPAALRVEWKTALVSLTLHMKKMNGTYNWGCNIDDLIPDLI
jgi:hypothetical protein